MAASKANSILFVLHLSLGELVGSRGMGGGSQQPSPSLQAAGANASTVGPAQAAALTAKEQADGATSAASKPSAPNQFRGMMPAYVSHLAKKIFSQGYNS